MQSADPINRIINRIAAVQPQTNCAAVPRYRWMAIVIALLAGHTIMILIGVYIAVHDPTFAVTPNYYEQAVHWDNHQAQLRASRDLGWNVTVQASPQVDATGRRAVAFLLSDNAGRAVPGASMEVEYLHHAHGQDGVTVTLQPETLDPRQFAGRLVMPWAGIWEFHVHVQAGGKTFLAEMTQWVDNAVKG